jgi:hypothetical protein
MRSSSATQIDAKFRCRVCGLRQETPPWGPEGHTPLFEHCPCCGVEFGYQDATPTGARRFRSQWIESGAAWAEPDAKPIDWDLERQLEMVPAEFA